MYNIYIYIYIYMYNIYIYMSQQWCVQEEVLVSLYMQQGEKEIMKNR